MTPPDDAVSDIEWYHSIELEPGEWTRGWFDLRPYIEHYGLPESMEGMRALDIGTWDGFWAFQMEDRGAEVVALDLDDESELDFPPRRRGEANLDKRRGEGFDLAKRLRGSEVERVVRNLYHATPEELGTFDVVFCGSVLIHVRDQLLALERIAALCRGTFITAEEYDRPSDLVPWPVSRYHADRDSAVVFWLPARKTWKKMLGTAGFDEVRQHSRFTMVSTDGVKIPHVVHHASASIQAAASNSS